MLPKDATELKCTFKDIVSPLLAQLYHMIYNAYVNNLYTFPNVDFYLLALKWVL